MLRELLLLLAIVFGVTVVFPLVETAATSPATLMQLATSRPAFYAGPTWVRPVRQRGMYFNNPQWDR